MNPTEVELNCQSVDPHAKVSNLKQNLLQAYFSWGGVTLAMHGSPWYSFKHLAQLHLLLKKVDDAVA